MNEAREKGELIARFSNGFTLIEVMMAVLILALLAGVGAMSFRKPLERAKGTDALQQVRFLDESARSVAKKFARNVVIEIDPQNGTLSRREGETVTYRGTIESPCEIAEVRTAEERSTDVVEISCSEMGLSRTYAVHVKGPDLDEWLVVAGLSGEVTSVNDERVVDDIFKVGEKAR